MRVQLSPAEMADNNYPLPTLDADTGELRCPPGFVVTQPAGQGIARHPPHEMLVRSMRPECASARLRALTRAFSPAGTGL